MKKTGERSVCCSWLILLFLLLAEWAGAGNLRYTVWENEEEEISIRVQNDTDKTVRVEQIILTFYDANGKSVDEQKHSCVDRCAIPANEVQDFGPYRKAKESEDCRVRHVKYTVLK